MKEKKRDKLRVSLSIDLDNEWSYLKVHGNESWKNYPSYLNVFLPYAFDLFDDLRIKVTFFVVGQDLKKAENIPYLKAICERGHSLANHSMNHDSWLQSIDTNNLNHEIGETDRLINELIGYKPKGFRGPGFSWNPKLIEILHKHGYKYDSTILPTFLGPLARWYYFRKSRLSQEEKDTRSQLFGKFSDGFLPLKPYVLKNSNYELWEIPVTTMPIFRTPFHLSYLVFLDGISPLLMRIYLYLAIILCKMTRVEPCFLLHPLDLIGGDQIRSLSFFPGMNISSERKKLVFNRVIEMLRKHFHLLSLDEFAVQLIEEKKQLPGENQV